jgi:hypothetical protein
MDLFEPNLIGKRIMAKLNIEFWKQQETLRQKEAQKLYDWYFNNRDKVHGYILTALSKTFPAETLEKMNIRVMNIVRRIIRKISLVNSQGIERMVDGGKKTEYEEGGESEIIESINNIHYQEALQNSTIQRKQREWRRLGIFFNTVLVQPVWVYDTANPKNPSFKPYLDFLIHTPAYTQVEVDDLNPLKAKAFWYTIVITTPSGTQNMTVYWSHTEHALYDMNGNKVPVFGADKEVVESNDKFVNPYQTLPIAIYRCDEGNDFWGNGLWDLVDGNEEICCQLTNLFYTAIFQSHGERVAVNMGLASPSRSGPDLTHAIDDAGGNGKQDAQMYFINANAPIDSIRGLIDWLIDAIQKLKGLTPQSSQIDPAAISGVAKIMDAAEIAEDRSEQMVVDNEFEYDLFHVFRLVWNYWNPSTKIGDDAKFSMKYVEPKPPQTVDEKIKEREAGLKNNWLSLVDIIMEDNVGLSREEAEEKLKEIIEQNRRLKDIYGIGETLNPEPLGIEEPKPPTEGVKSEGE